MNRNADSALKLGHARGVAVLAAALLLALPLMLGQSLVLNLGHSAWLIALVLGAFAASLRRLHGAVAVGPGATAADGYPAAAETAATLPQRRTIAKLDQLTDVWIHLFVGIGVIWTAVGMRSALQAALGDGGALADSAGSVLKRLVDGGILLALTTTIVGGIGSYLMRLVKTIAVGANLHQHYDAVQSVELKALVASVARIERQLALRPAVVQPPEAA